MTWFAALHVPQLPVALARRDDPLLSEQPLLLTRVSSGRTAVAASDAPGCSPGMTLRQAQLRSPAAQVRAADPASAAAAIAGLRSVMARHSPRLLAEQRGSDLTVLGDLGKLRDAQQLFVAATRLHDDAQAALGMPITLGLGASPLIAQLAAQIGANGAIVVVLPGQEAAFLAPQPVGNLPIDTALLGRLTQFGLTTIGLLAAMPPAALAARFGSAGSRLAQLAHGQDQRALQLIDEPRQILVGLRFAGPISDQAQLIAALPRILNRAHQRLLAGGWAATRLTITCTHPDAPATSIVRELPAATSDRIRLQQTILNMLAATPLPAAVATLALTIDLHAEQAQQRDLFAASMANDWSPPAWIAGRVLRATLNNPAARCLDQRVSVQPWEAP